MKLRPLMDRVVLRQVENEEVSKGGIILTNAAKEKPQMAEVVAAESEVGVAGTVSADG